MYFHVCIIHNSINHTHTHTHRVKTKNNIKNMKLKSLPYTCIHNGNLFFINIYVYYSVCLYSAFIFTYY